MSAAAQNFDNHAKMVPWYHYYATALVVLPTLYFAFLAATDFSLERLALVAFCFGTIVLGLFARLFPLGVQDRVIRLEERMRMQQVLPADLGSRIPEFTTDQLIGLRFAADDELEELSRRVLAGELADRKAIKQAVGNWRADNQRI